MAHTIGPAYYQLGKIQVWDFIRDQGLNFHLGNAIKYICRAGHKGVGGLSMSEAYIQDLKKAIHYLQNELENEIFFVNTSPGISGCVPNSQQQEPYISQYTEDFDR